MRNLKEYPVTHGEVCSILQEAQAEFYEKYNDNLGSTHGLSLFYAEQFIRKYKKTFDRFTKIK